MARKKTPTCELELQVRAVATVTSVRSREHGLGLATPRGVKIIGELPTIVSGETVTVTVQATARPHELAMWIRGASKPWQLTVHIGDRIMASGTTTGRRRLSFKLDPLAIVAAEESLAPPIWEASVVLTPAGNWPRRLARTGRIQLRQEGSGLSGVMTLGRSRLAINGRWRAQGPADTAITLGGKGVLGTHDAEICLHGPLSGNRVVGSLTGTLGAGLLFGGGITLRDIQFQQRPGGAQQRRSRCGRLLWQKVYTGAAGPANNRRRYRFRIKRYERCVCVEYLDRRGNVIDRILLGEDLRRTVNRKRVLVFDRAMNDVPITPGAHPVKWTGEMKVILVQGCRRTTFVQYTRDTARVEKPNGQTTRRTGPWAPDGSTTSYPGTLTLPAQAGSDAGGMADQPGMDAGTVAGTTAVVGRLLARQPNGTRYVQGFEAEAFVCCDGTLLGIVACGYELTWTKANGTVSGPVATEVAPTWRTPSQSQSGATVTC